jgi:hypothetical protein
VVSKLNDEIKEDERGNVARMGKKNVYGLFVGKPEGNRPPVVWNRGIDRRKALLNMVMKLQVPQNAGKFLSSCITGGL